MLREKAIFTIIALLLICGFAFSDVINFKDGRKIEGKIVYKDSKIVRIKTKYGTNEFSMADILNIDEKETKEQEYNNLVKKTNPKDTEAVMKLVDWCNENDMKSHARNHLKEILEYDPNNEEARKRLGYVKNQGKWITPRELAILKEKEDREEKQSKGLVEYKGEWLPKEDVEKIESGLIKYKGEWVTKEEKNRLENNLVLYEGLWVKKEDAEKMKQGLFNVGGLWVKKEEADRAHSNWEDPWILKTKHVTIKTSKNYDYTLKMLADADLAYNRIKELVKIEPDLKETLITVYVLSSIEEYNNIGNAIGDERSSAYSVFYAEESPEDGQITVTYARSDPKKGDTDDYVRYTLGLVRHSVVEQYLRRIDEKDEIPLWFIIGQAAKVDRFHSEAYISYYIKELRKQGGFIKTKQFFDSYFSFSEQQIYQAGLLCAYLDSNDADEQIKDQLNEVIKAIGEKKRISRAFLSLEKSLIKGEKSIRDYISKH